MALICKKIFNIKEIYRNKLKEILNNPILSQQPSSIIDKISFKHTFTLVNLLNDMEMNSHSLYHKLEENLSKKIDPSCNNTDIFQSFKFLVDTRSTNSILSKYLNFISTYPDYFKKNQIEEITKIINSESIKSLVTPDVISGILSRHNSSLKSKKITFNVKKSKSIIKNDLIHNCLKVNKFLFNYIRYDSENVCLQFGNEKQNKSQNLSEDDNFDVSKFQNLITFCELDDIQTNDIMYFQSLINSINPNVVLINNEPFVSFNNNSFKSTNTSALEERKYFKDKQDFIQLLEKIGDYKSRNLESTVYYKSSGYLAIVESIIFYCCSKNIKSELFDLPINDFVSSYLDKIESFKFSQDVNVLADLTNIVSLLNWIKIQENSGCLKCANYFNKKAIKIEPTPLEFLFDKKILPNYEKINTYRIKSLYEAFKTDKNVLVFTNDIFSDTKDFIDYYNLTDEERKNYDMKNVNAPLDLKNKDYSKAIESLKFKSNSDRFYFNKMNDNKFYSIISNTSCDESFATKFNDDLKIQGMNDISIDESVLNIVKSQENKCGIDSYFKEKMI